METAFITEYINGNTALGALALVFLYRKMGDLTDSVDKLNNTIVQVLTNSAVQDEKLENGNLRFEKVESDIEYLRKRCHDISNNLHALRNNTMSKEQINEVIKALDRR